MVSYKKWQLKSLKISGSYFHCKMSSTFEYLNSVYFGFPGVENGVIHPIKCRWAPVGKLLENNRKEGTLSWRKNLKKRFS